MFQKSIVQSFMVIFLMTAPILAQDKIAFGGAGMYNFPIKTIGFGLRSQILIANRLSVVPQFKYAPKFNEIHEYFGGINFHYAVFNNTAGFRNKIVPQKPLIYLAAGMQYNRWINFVPTTNPRAKKNNFLPEAGLGISAGSSKFRGFIEGKANILWKESYGEVGVLFFPFNKKQRKNNSCPKIN